MTSINVNRNVRTNSKRYTVNGVRVGRAFSSTDVLPSHTTKTRTRTSRKG